ncbi:hypothetical protein PMAYCL1PPCAC_25651, partial [Pristionchus mayeri]
LLSKFDIEAQSDRTAPPNGVLSCRLYTRWTGLHLYLFTVTSIFEVVNLSRSGVHLLCFSILPTMRAANRPSKRGPVEVIKIDDDGEDDGNIAAKKPTPSPEFTKLQDQNRKLERDLQSCIRIAGEKQQRIEFLEQLIDQKPNIASVDPRKMEELEKRIIELTTGQEE